MTTNDVAVFLDLDNLVISAKQINREFDINLILDHIREVTGSRVVLRRAYGDWRQNQQLLRDLARAGFVTQANVPINHGSKNLADIQIVVDAMDTLVDGHQYGTYVLISGDRDFTPLVQSLRKRGKQVIGYGVQETASNSLVELCDRYFYYESLFPAMTLAHVTVEELLSQALRDLLKKERRVRASVLKQRMVELSNGAFSSIDYEEKSFRQFLEKHVDIVSLELEETTLYVGHPDKSGDTRDLHLCYRTALKKQRLRIVPVALRLSLLRDLIHQLQQEEEIEWRQLQNSLNEKYQQNGLKASKNMINAVMLVARRAEVIHTLKGDSLATASVTLALQTGHVVQEAIMRCDATYLWQIQQLPEPFDLTEAALALYETADSVPYLQRVMRLYPAPPSRETG